MKKANVKIGQTYSCKVGRNLTEVRIDGESPHGGWNATNVKTGRGVRIKSAQRLRATARGGATGASVKTKAADGAKAEKGRATREKGAHPAKKAKKTGLLNAAIQVLRETGQPMNTKEVVDAVKSKGLWSSNGKTPAATLYASILREIQRKGDEARFEKVERGKFALKS